MQLQTLAVEAPGTKPQRAKKKSPWRVLHERLQKAGASPVAARVAIALEAYARTELGTGRIIAAVYHEKLAAETGVSPSTVRRALRELTTGDAPLYVARDRTGQARTIRGQGGFSMTTKAVVYERIDDLDAFLAARDVARTANVLDYEQRKRQHHGERVMAQRALLTGEITEADYQAQVEDIDARTRGRLPKAATEHKPTRCLTPAQVERFAADFLAGGAYAELVHDGPKRVREFHALHRHVFGGNDGDGCRACEQAVAQHAASHRYITDYLKAQVTTCGCGAVVVVGCNAQAVAFADINLPTAHDCPHEQNRLLKLRAQKEHKQWVREQHAAAKRGSW